MKQSLRKKLDCRGIRMGKMMLIVVAGCMLLGALPAAAQVKMTKEQMMFYTSEWKGDRFPDGPQGPGRSTEACSGPLH